ncbi:class I SAM-dependent methyltransferase [Salinirubrum litoreum]|uniref:Class I SAM-dependent methyltransferase n=1 Tax=Salinirubrum litoreum TaxID=1126234 RepID=A0ABD5RAC2_9EURY|nr:methyltransferase domain-containing protein [Salinirubrum litoreum]
MDYGPGDTRFFDRLARLYDLGMPRARKRHLDVGLSLAERPVGRVLDVGGGTGRAAVELDAAERIVVDAARGMLTRARDRGLDTVQGDARRLPVADQSADAVTIVDAFHHLPDQRRVVREAWRVLAPGGVLVVRDFDPDTLLGRGLVLAEDVVGFDSTFTGPDDLAAFLGDAGFRTAVPDRGFGYTVAGVKPGSK